MRLWTSTLRRHICMSTLSPSANGSAKVKVRQGESSEAAGDFFAPRLTPTSQERSNPHGPHQIPSLPT